MAQLMVDVGDVENPKASVDIRICLLQDSITIIHTYQYAAGGSPTTFHIEMCDHVFCLLAASHLG